MKKSYFLLLLVLAFCTGTFAQPTVLGTQLVNGSYTTYNLNSIGLFRQFRLQATSSAAISTRNWEFASGTAATPDYTTNWRPNTAGNTLFSNIFIPTLFANGARYNTASGGANGLLPVITAGNYYTFNVNINAAADNEMELLETSYNPVTITSVSNTTPANASNSVLITCTVSAAPASGEYVYVRYSTTGYATSALSQFTFTGTTGQALIPCHAGATVVSYYVMSSNQTAAQITTDVGIHGQSANDMATLNLNNNGGPNYSYTQGSGGFFGGIYSTPSTCYATVSAFVSALNPGTVTAPVTMYAVGGSATETATAGGISITQTGTFANPIVFKKFGTGSYTIQASAALTVGNINDAVIKLIGADYITIDGFTLQENAANTISATGATNNMTEFGVALLRASTTDGPQNNTIQNNTISLDRTYTNTFGIYSNSRASATAVATIADITNISGSSFGNKIYGNTISNVNYGVVFNGSGIAGQLDNNNDIGGSSLATGNTFTNWGSAGTAISGYPNLTGSNYCIFVNQQTNDNISYNTITGATHITTNTHGGILKNNTLAQPTGTISSTISYNTITVTSSNATGNMTVIQNAGLTALSTATISISNNTIVNCAITGAATTAQFIGITNSSVPGVLNMNSNVLKGNNSTASAGLFQGIANSGAIVTTLNMNNNQLGIAGSGAVTFSVANNQNFNCIYNTNAAATATVNMNNNSVDGISVVSTGVFNTILNNATSAAFANMNNNQLGTVTGTFITFTGAQASSFTALNNVAGSSTATTSIQNNDVRGVVHSVAASCNEFYIYSGAANLSHTVANNTFTNLNVNTTGYIYCIFDAVTRTSGQTATFNNNSIVAGLNKSAPGNSVYGFYNGGSSVNGATNSITNNNFSNITVTGATNIYGIIALDGLSSINGPTNIITGNAISNLNSSGGCYGIYVDYAAAVTCSSNTISNLTGTSNITGIEYQTNNGQGIFTTSSNTISSLVSSGTGGNVTGVYTNAASVPTMNVNGNTITGLSSTGASSWTYGLLLNVNPTINVYDNIINTLSGSGTTAPTAMGIYISAGLTVNVYRNKINSIEETGAISTVSPAVNGIQIQNGTNVTIYNNFIADLKATNASMNDAIRGINFPNASASGTYNVYYNSIYVNAASTGTNFGTSGIYHLTNATATTAALNLIDNIIVNTSTANGTGVTAAYRRSDATLTNYASTSDYNLFYAGTPGPTRLIYYDGTNSDQTLAAYQTRVSTRDANSISLMPTFTSATNLHLTTANCGIDGRGTPTFVLTDIDGIVRDVTTPDIGADEFTATYSSTTLAGVVSTAVCDSKNVSASPTVTTYATSVCDLIAKVLPSGADPVAGRINVCVTRDASQLFFNGEPYVQRHYDIEPASSPATATATVTLYFTDAEFVLYNTNNTPVWPALPTAVLGNADPNIANLKVTQFHGTPTGGLPTSTPGNYTGTRLLITPLTVVLNGTIWSVTFNVTGFSGFYVHTNLWNSPLPVSINYFTGTKQGSNHLLNWKVTCNSTPSVTMTLERSASSAAGFTGINTINATAARCNQPFNYTDAQPLKGMNYYRLKMVDVDGKISYSSIVALLNAVKGFDIISIAPNPVTDGNFKLNVASAQSSKMEFVIFDMQGRLVNRQTVSVIAGYNNIPVNVGNLSSGTYTIQATIADDRSRVMRFVKQ